MDYLIPVRTSSKAAIQQRQVHLANSRSDLKRKLSQISFEKELIAYRKIRIEDMEFQVKEQRVHKSWLDIELEQKYITDSVHRKEHQATNKRIVSLGDDLWKENEQLRLEEEKAGRVPQLNPDAKGAFVHTLLALYKDPRDSKKRSSKIQSSMKAAAIQVYEVKKDTPIIGKIWCCVTQRYYDQEKVRAAHIVPHSLTPSLVDYIFGNGSGARLDTADNCLLMHSDVERAFDNGNFVLLPVDNTRTPILRWKVKITNLAAVNMDILGGVLKDFDGIELSFKNERRPASRFLYYHFVITLLRNKRDRQPGWEKFLVELSTDKPFATMGRYMRESMLLTLVKSAGDLDVEAEARLLGGEEGGETFVEKERLAEIEESEVARRIFEALEAKEGEEEGEEEEEEEGEEEREEGGEEEREGEGEEEREEEGEGEEQEGEED